MEGQRGKEAEGQSQAVRRKAARQKVEVYGTNAKSAIQWRSIS